MIVLAGGIGSGKSVVARILRLKGFGVFDCDFEARRLMESDPCVKAALMAAVGSEIYDDSGSLNRKFLASRIFNDPESRRVVNAIVHNAVKDSIRRWILQDRNNLFVETAIPAQSGIAEMASQIWIVDASVDSRLARVRSRDDRSVEEILKIMDAQAREEEAIFSFHNVKTIHNNPADSLLTQIDSLLSYSKI